MQVQKLIFSLTKVEKAYLAGLLDGEGYISITLGRGSDGKQYYQPVVGILSSVHEDFVRKVEDILSKSDLKFYHITVKRGKPIYFKTQRQLFQVTLKGQNRCRSFLSEIEPYLVLKKDIAQITIEWCESRIERRGHAYNHREIEIIKEVRKLNGERTGRIKYPYKEIERIPEHPVVLH